MIFSTCHIKIKQKISDVIYHLEKGSLLCSRSAMWSLIFTLHTMTRECICLIFHSSITDKREDNKSLRKERKKNTKSVYITYWRKELRLLSSRKEFPLCIIRATQQKMTVAYMTSYHATAWIPQNNPVIADQIVQTGRLKSTDISTAIKIYSRWETVFNL